MSSSESLAARAFPLARGLVLRNRLVGTAHAAGLVSGGLALPGDADYWRRRAAGGAAMLVVGGTVTAPESTWRRRVVTEAWREEAVPGMAARAEAIRGEGAVAACQLVHLGRETTGAEMWFPPVAPSAVRSPREPVRPRPLTDGEVDAIIEGFRVSAVNALAAGFQVIELHAAHGYLLGQFLSAVTNQRPGAGSLAARAGIIARITGAIRGSAPGAVIGIRLSTDGGEEAGLTLDGLCELLPHVSLLADYINLTVGVRTTYVRDMATAEPPLLPHLARIRPLTSTSLLVSQAFRRADQIDAALGAGADLVGMARPLIADPDLPAKLLSGRAAQVRPCVSCNEDCRTFDPVLLCSVNPELAPDGAGRRPAAPLLAQQAGGGQGDRVAIVGAGPAGLECAVALADGSTLAGAAEVVVFDQRDVIGGQLAVAAAAPNRAGWQALLDFYQASLDAADGITLRLGTTAGPADLAGFGEVILAVGSEEVLPEVVGIERAVASSLAIASGPSALAGREHLLIVDDGFGSWSCASAVELGVRAAVPRITVATPGAAFGASLPAEGRVQLIARLRGAPLDVLPFTALSSVGDGWAEITNMMSRTTWRIAVDTVIVVGERRARDWRSLVPSGPTVRVLGDALVPRRVAHAISDGRAAADAIRASRANLPVTAAPA
jgi:2,4-dienoyl-CoA reductase-like NADH-dependent reductase (Old Yellow Enzyme family)